MERKVFFRHPSGENLCGILVTPDEKRTSPVFILVHGHSSNKNTKNLVKLSEILQREAIATFRIDLFGHGESGGRFEDATITKASESILSAIQYLEGLGYNKIGLLGSSYGGISSIIAASKTKDLFALALKSPVCNYAELYNSQLTKKQLEDWKKTGFYPYFSGDSRELRLSYAFYEDAKKNDGYEAIKNIGVPVLIVHGDKDTDVPLAQSLKLIKLAGNAQLKIIKGSDHRYTNEKHTDEMIRLISEFMIKEAKKQEND
ncbi:MAG TPA: alpha/beta fold hydrolase [Patescibacteria group bacterium]|nr:alpha/beta fold hydrolase [Patescibacteria group bacterium]